MDHEYGGIGGSESGGLKALAIKVLFFPFTVLVMFLESFLGIFKGSRREDNDQKQGLLGGNEV